MLKNNLYKLFGRDIVSIYLILLSIQIIPIEGNVVSWTKIILMAFSPIFLLRFSPCMTKAVKLGGLYILALSVSVFINREDFRFTSFFYRVCGVFSFMLFYNLINVAHVLSKDYLIKLVSRLIQSYGIVLIIQQLSKILFVHYGGSPILNLVPIGSDRSILCVNSLSLEPSHSARILGALFITLFRLVQLHYNNPVKTLKHILSNNKSTILLFTWSMVSMDSGTAFVVLGIILLLFIKEKYLLIGIGVGILIIPIIGSIADITPLKRVVASSTALSTGDMQKVQEADLSASARIVPFLYTCQNLDLSSFDQWFGQGIDTAKKRDEWGVFQFIGEIDDYGILAYIFSLLLFFKCSICRIISVETIFFIIVMMAEIGNVYYVWSISMLFASIKYFYNHPDQSINTLIFVDNERNQNSRAERNLSGDTPICG